MKNITKIVIVTAWCSFSSASSMYESVSTIAESEDSNMCKKYFSNSYYGYIANLDEHNFEILRKLNEDLAFVQKYSEMKTLKELGTQFGFICNEVETFRFIDDLIIKLYERAINTAGINERLQCDLKNMKKYYQRRLEEVFKKNYEASI